MPDRPTPIGVRSVLTAVDLRSRASLRLPGKGLQPKHRPIDDERTARTKHRTIVRASTYQKGWLKFYKKRAFVRKSFG